MKDITVNKFREYDQRKRQDILDEYLKESEDFRYEWDFLQSMGTPRRDSSINHGMILAKTRRVLGVNGEDSISKVFDQLIVEVSGHENTNTIYFLDVVFMDAMDGSDVEFISAVRYDYKKPDDYYTNNLEGIDSETT